MSNELKISLVIDPESLKEFQDKIQSSIGSLKGGVGNSNFKSSQKNVELDKIKIEKELFRLAVLKRKEEERQLKEQQKQSKILEKNNKEMSKFSSLLSKMGFKGSFSGEVIRGSARQLGVNITNAIGDNISKLSGGYVSGSGAISGMTTGAIVGSAIPVVGTIIGGAIGMALGGLLVPWLEKQTDPMAKRMEQLRNLLEVKYKEGDIDYQQQALKSVYQRESQKNIMNLASGGKLGQKESGATVEILKAMGIDPVAFHSMALKLSKSKDSEYYGVNVLEIMDRLATALGSKQYTKEERYANYEKIQNSEGLKNLLSAVVDPNLLFRAIDKGTIEKDIDFYLKQGINESKTNKAVDLAVEDNVTTPMEILKAQTEFVRNNVNLVVDYENALVASQNRTLESTKGMTSSLNTMNIALDNSRNTLEKFVDTAKNVEPVVVQKEQSGWAKWNPFD